MSKQDRPMVSFRFTDNNELIVTLSRPVSPLDPIWYRVAGVAEDRYGAKERIVKTRIQVVYKI